MSKPPPTEINWEVCKDSTVAARRVRDHLDSSTLTQRYGFKILEYFSKKAWIVGSHVWRPALYVQPDFSSDLDVIFPNEASLKIVEKDLEKNFIKSTPNAFGSCTFNFKRTDIKAFDLWVLPKDSSIAEHIDSFPETYQKFAYAAGIPVDFALTRTIGVVTLNLTKPKNIPPQYRHKGIP